jgi:2'-5' RNA ligase
VVANLGRIFVGIAPTEEARLALVDALVGLPGLPGRVAAPENWHLTLRFIGRMDEVSFDRLLGDIDQKDRGGPFRLRLAGLGAFPNPRRAAVLWVGVDQGSTELTALAGQMEEIVTGIGMEAEDRPFHPHLTLSRIRPPQNVVSLLDAGEAISVTWRADRVTIYSSTAGSGSVRYETLETFVL